MSLILNTKPTQWRVRALKYASEYEQLHGLNLRYMLSFTCLFGNCDLTLETFFSARGDETDRNQQMKVLQLLVNRLNDCRKVRSY